MITALIFLLKVLYWMIIGWWLEPIKWLNKRKYQKMEKEIIKNKYEQIKKSN